MNKKQIQTFKFFFIKISVGLFSLFFISYAQDTRVLKIQAGDFLAYIDMYNAHFSMLDLSQDDLDFSSVLFGSVSVPSSYIAVYVDEKVQTFDQMIPVYPFGMSLGAQVDGIFLAGDKNDVQVELAFFPMNISGDSKVDTIGIAARISNMSQVSTRKVSVRIMLDTDIGEADNDPLIYLPTREKITNAFVFSATNIPPYLFIGNLLFAELDSSQQTFYLYPFLSTNIPSTITVGNWKRVSDKNKTPLAIYPSLSYNSTGLKDAGISIYFGTYNLSPRAHQNFGVAISKQFSSLWPVIEDQAIENGVFNPDRFAIEETLRGVKGSLLIQKEKNTGTEGLFLGANFINYQNRQQRQLFRQNQIGMIPNNKDQFRQSNLNVIKNMKDGVIWSYLNGLDLAINQIDFNLDKILDQNVMEKSYDTPPSTGILKTNFYEK